jgi:hypothetical protein
MKKYLLLSLIIVFQIDLLIAQGTWIPVNPGLNAAALAMTEYDGELYIGKLNFSLPDEIKKWNGTSFSNVGTGTNGPVGAFAEYNNDLYVGGGFTIAGGQAANDVAKWNGSSWSSVNSPLDNFSINALAVYNNELYAGGYGFNASGSVNSLYTIARYDGANWSAVASGIQGGDIYSLAVYNGDLYAGGSFTIAGGMAVNRIAKWNGSSWSDVGGGVTGTIVYTLAVYNNELYAGGQFTAAGGNNAVGIAKWNGTSWSDVGNGMDNTVISLTAYNNELYAGGAFTFAGSDSANHIAKWNGTSWTSLGNGVGIHSDPNEQVWCIAPYLNNIYAGGSFTEVDGMPAADIAMWNINTGINTISGNNSINIHPIPVQSNSVLDVNTNEKEIILNIYDLINHKIATYNFSCLNRGMNSISIAELQNLSPGIYIAEINFKKDRKTELIYIK